MSGRPLSKDGSWIVKNMVSEFSMDSVNVHGCMLGVKHSKNGKPIKKPWTIKSSNSLLLLSLSHFKCNHKPHEHEVCAGAQTVLTGFYPFEFSDAVMNGLSGCLLYTSPSPRDRTRSRMPSSA